MAKGHYCKLGA